jgi:hypothetical protein
VSSPIGGAQRASVSKSPARGHHIGWLPGFGCRGVSRNRRRRRAFRLTIVRVSAAYTEHNWSERSWRRSRQNKGKGASLLGWDEEAVRGRQKAIELSMEKSVGGVQAAS